MRQYINTSSYFDNECDYASLTKTPERITSHCYVNFRRLAVQSQPPDWSISLRPRGQIGCLVNNALTGSSRTWRPLGGRIVFCDRSCVGPVDHPSAIVWHDTDPPIRGATRADVTKDTSQMSCQRLVGTPHPTLAPTRVQCEADDCGALLEVRSSAGNAMSSGRCSRNASIENPRRCCTRWEQSRQIWQHGVGGRRPSTHAARCSRFMPMRRVRNRCNAHASMRALPLVSPQPCPSYRTAIGFTAVSTAFHPTAGLANCRGPHPRTRPDTPGLPIPF